MVVQHNISAMTANRYYGVNNKGLASSLEKLASGYAINKAGDNAAGLAVSEKMRAQIGGLTQASKNAEDGISMVQTFEGALQETDSILQRMRTLAVQSANGSYQDDVDRDAIQLEFDQLNDELNQIADTDFNGTVMLNGGTMADGVKAHDGKIDYATKRQDVTDGARAALQKNIDEADAAVKAARKVYGDSNYDLSSKGDAAEWNTVDDSRFTKANADAVWVNLGITKPGNADDKFAANTADADAVNVVFKYDGDSGEWKIDSGWTEKGGEKVKDLDADTIGNAMEVETQSIDGASGFGGFKVAAKAADDYDGNAGAPDTTSKDGLGNAILDASKVKDGDTVTLRWTNSEPTKNAPTNIGFKLGSTDVQNSGTTDDALTLPTLSLGTLKDTDITEDIANKYNALDGAQLAVNYTKAGTTTTATLGGQNLDLTTTGSTVTINDQSFFIKGSAAIATNGGDIEIYDKAGDDGKLLAKIVGLAANGNNTVGGTITGTLALDYANYTNGTGVTLSAGDDPNLESSGKAYQNVVDAEAKLDAANKAMTEFNKLNNTKDNDWEKIKQIYSEEMSSSGTAVSFSDNFDNSAAKMTYTDQMSLQVGARTKDIVNFNFQYACDDLGGLEKNLNCSAREGGLETAGLSLRTQKDANDAIDQIDKALNKVNMVRATFGAVQNRLEHKINNIDTNTENMTAAESRIRDTQMDKEMMKFTSSQILSQASQSMLAQANQLPQGVLQLLG